MAEAAEDQEGCLDAGLAQSDRLIDDGHSEIARSLLKGDAADLESAMAVGVRLDHRHDAGRGHLPADALQIESNRPEVDLSSCRPH